MSIRTITSYLQVASMLSLYKMQFPDFVSAMVVGQAVVSSPGEAITNVDCMGVAGSQLSLFVIKQVITFAAPFAMLAVLAVVHMSGLWSAQSR